MRKEQNDASNKQLEELIQTVDQSFFKGPFAIIINLWDMTKNPKLNINNDDKSYKKTLNSEDVLKLKDFFMQALKKEYSLYKGVQFNEIKIKQKYLYQEMKKQLTIQKKIMYDESNFFMYELQKPYIILKKEAKILKDKKIQSQQQNLFDIDKIKNYIGQKTYIKELNDQIDIDMLKIKEVNTEECQDIIKQTWTGIIKNAKQIDLSYQKNQLQKTQQQIFQYNKNILDSDSSYDMDDIDIKLKNQMSKSQMRRNNMQL